MGDVILKYPFLTEKERKAIRLKLTLAIIESILAYRK